MGDVNITVSTRFLERIVYWIIIIALIIGLVVTVFKYQDLKNNGPQPEIIVQEEETDTSGTGEETTEEETTTQETVEEPECTRDVDCDLGYECIDQECIEKVDEVECRLHSDCDDKGEQYKCRDNECVFEPECTIDEDCDSGQECKNNMCEDIPLSGDVEIEVKDIEYIYDNEMENTRLESFDLEIVNGLDEDVDYVALIWFLGDSQRFNIGSNSWKYGFEYENDLSEIDLPTIESGETYTKKIKLTHNDGEAGGNWPLGGIDDSERAYFEIRFYEDRDYSDSDFDPDDTRHDFYSDDFDLDT